MFRCSAKGKPSGHIPSGFPSALPFPNPYPSQAMLFGVAAFGSGGVWCDAACTAAVVVAFYRRFVGG